PQLAAWCSTASRSRWIRLSRREVCASARKLSADECCVGEEAHASSALDSCHVLREFEQPIRFGQRRQNTRTILRGVYRLGFAVGGTLECHPHIFATVLLFPVRESHAHRQRQGPIRPGTGKSAQ